jgi:hypothetical protein
MIAEVDNWDLMQRWFRFGLVGWISTHASRSSSSDSPLLDASRTSLSPTLLPAEPPDMLVVDVCVWEVLYSAGLDYCVEWMCEFILGEIKYEFVIFITDLTFPTTRQWFA